MCFTHVLGEGIQNERCRSPVRCAETWERQQRAVFQRRDIALFTEVFRNFSQPSLVWQSEADTQLLLNVSFGILQGFLDAEYAKMFGFRLLTTYPTTVVNSIISSSRVLFFFWVDSYDFLHNTIISPWLKIVLLFTFQLFTFFPCFIALPGPLVQCWMLRGKASHVAPDVWCQLTAFRRCPLAGGGGSLLFLVRRCGPSLMGCL